MLSNVDINGYHLTEDIGHLLFDDENASIVHSTLLPDILLTSTNNILPPPPPPRFNPIPRKHFPNPLLLAGADNPGKPIGCHRVILCARCNVLDNLIKELPGRIPLLS